MMRFVVMRLCIARNPFRAKTNSVLWGMQISDLVIALCVALPGAGVSQPFGSGVDVWKVAGKIFAILDRDHQAVAVKTADTNTAHLIIEMGHGTRAPYLHSSWVRVPFDAVGLDEVTERLDTSYRLIRAALPKKVQVELGPMP